MKAPWTHALCLPCYRLLEPEGDPVRRRVSEEELKPECCHCGTDTDSGIWYRQDPAKMNCDGSGGVHESVD